MIFHMRRAIEWRLSPDDAPDLGMLALGHAAPDQLITSFFAICEHVADLDEDEEDRGMPAE